MKQRKFCRECLKRTFTDASFCDECGEELEPIEDYAEFIVATRGFEAQGRRIES